MASFRKLKNGKYQATIFIGRDLDGKQIRKYITCETLKECKKAAAELEAQSNLSNISSMCFDVWISKWLEINEARLSPSTFLAYKMYSDVHLIPYFKRTKLNKITDIQITDFINTELKTISKCTVKKHFVFLRKVLFDALKNDSPMIGMSAPIPDKYKPHIVTTEEFKTIYELFKGDKYEIVILLAGLCGMRRGEIFGLRWKDVDFKNSELKIRNAVVTSKNGYVDKPPKSNNGIRDIKAPQIVMDKLKELKPNILGIDEKVMSQCPDSFTNYYINKMEKAELDIRFHDLRHYHATWLYENGIPDLYVAERLGHDVKVLKGIYQHLGVDKKKSLDKSIANSLNNII